MDDENPSSQEVHHPRPHGEQQRITQEASNQSLLVAQLPREQCSHSLQQSSLLLLSSSSSKNAAAAAGSVHLVLQRFRYCRLLINNQTWVEVGDALHMLRVDNDQPNDDEEVKEEGHDQKVVEEVHEETTALTTTDRRRRAQHHTPFCGLLAYVSFAASATEEAVHRAAHALVRMPLLTKGLWGDNHATSTSESSPTLSLLDWIQNEDVGESSPGAAGRKAPGSLTTVTPPTTALVLVPQANLIAKCRSGGKSFQYHGQLDKERGRVLYDRLVRTVRDILLDALVAHYDLSGSLPPSYSRPSVTSIPRGTAIPPPPSLPPTQLFRQGILLYRAWDEQGIPTHGADGEPISRSARKKLVKVWMAHAKKHDKWMQQQPTAEAEVETATDDCSDGGGAVPLTLPPDSTSVDASADDLPPPAGTAEISCDGGIGVDEGHDNDGPDGDRVNNDASLLNRYCPVVAGTFGTRQGLRIDSDMGPFCHVVQLP